MSKKREGIEKAKEVADKMKDTLETIDGYANKVDDAVKKLSKLAKYAKAFGAASVILDIGLGFFPQEDQKEKMLKEIIGLMGGLKKQITTLSNDMDAGFTKIYKDSEHRVAKARVIDAVKTIQTSANKIHDLTKINPFAPEYKNNKALLRTRMVNARTAILELGYVNLAEAQTTLRSACVEDGVLGLNILKTATASSNADITYLYELGQRLISMATLAYIGIRFYWDLSEEVKFEEAEQEYKDDKAINADNDKELEYLNKRIEEKRAYKIDQQEAAHQREMKIFDKTISDIEEAMKDQALVCKKYETVVMQNNVKHGVKAALDKIGMVDNAGTATEKLFEELSKMWPDVKLAVTVNENAAMHYWNTFGSAHIGLSHKMEEVTSSNGKYKAIVIVVNSDDKVPETYSWRTVISYLKEHLSLYVDYYRDDNLSSYTNDSNIFGHHPYAFFKTASLNRGVVVSPGLTKTYVLKNDGHAYDVIVPY